MPRSISCPACGHDKPRVHLEWSHAVVSAEETPGVRPAATVVTLSAMQKHKGTKFLRAQFACPKCFHKYKKPRGVRLELDHSIDEEPEQRGADAGAAPKIEPRTRLYLVPDVED